MMRAKRSKDSQLVDKFSKHRDDLAAESRLHLSIDHSTSDRASTHTAGQDVEEEEEDSDLQVKYESSQHVHYSVYLHHLLTLVYHIIFQN